jgi:hypothetical protein
MRLVKRILRGIAVLIAFLLYVWYGAVRQTPAVKRRKARMRAVGRTPRGR